MTVNDIIEGTEVIPSKTWHFRPPVWIDDVVLEGADLISVLRTQCVTLAAASGQKSPIIKEINVRPLLNIRQDGDPRYEITITGMNLQAIFTVVFLCIEGDDELDATYPDGFTLTTTPETDRFDVLNEDD
jgi:hypothetical protein